jgi:hypothetical protein
MAETAAMVTPSENWSEQRRITAQRVASVLYGVVAIMTADLAMQPGRFGYAEASLGVLLIGLAMTMTRVFVRVVAKETEICAHLPIGEFVTIIRESLLVMLFPVITVVLVVAGAMADTGWTILLDEIMYVGMLTVFVIGFLSSYILDRKMRLALRRAFVWLLLSFIIVAAKSFA